VQRLIRGSRQLCVLAFIAIVLIASAQAATFSNSSLQGTYAFLGNRWTADISAPQGGVIGIMTFDGIGNMTESYTGMVNGSPVSGTFTGTYAVNPDGAGTITFSTGWQWAIVLNSTSAKIAHGIQLLSTLNLGYNEVGASTAVLQSTTAKTYSVANLKGDFSFVYNEWTADPSQPDTAGDGLFIFDGKGNVKGSSSDMQGATLQTETFTGAYTVNSDGSGAISLSTGEQYVFVLNTATGTLAQGLQFVQTNTTGNLAICGIAHKQ
jgi:hypothetical protein